MSVKTREGSFRKDKRKSRAQAQKTSRLTLLTEDDQNMVISVAEELSKIVGINPDTVCKKKPSRISSREDNIRKKRNCFDRFIDSEERCAIANNYWLGLGSHEPSLAPIAPVAGDPDIEYVLNYAVRFINRAFSNVKLSKADYLYVGPGAANVHFSVPKMRLPRKIRKKLRNPPSPATGMYELARSDDRISKFSRSLQSGWIRPSDEYDPRYFFEDQLAEYIDENLSVRTGHDVLMTVPKNEQTDRMIGVNSVIGIASQHVNGRIIREALKRCSVDLNNLQSEHKYLAYLGSKTGEFQTIDFEMASDTISVALVNILFNNVKSSDKVRKFYKMLRMVRSTSYGNEMCVSTDYYEKWAPMGHADTFELETLIFTALANGIQSLIGLSRINKGEDVLHEDWRKATAFGDDVILNIPHITDAEVAVIERIFLAFGLHVNHEKSFYKGVGFRESCGADFSEGRYVRGFYLKKAALDATDVIRLINFFTVHYDIGYSLICATFPCFKRLCDSLHLERYVTAPEYIDSGVLSPYLVVPDDIILSNDLPRTDVRIVMRPTSQFVKDPLGYLTVDDVLVPQKVGVGNPAFCNDNFVSILEEPDLPLIWAKKRILNHTYVPDKVRKRGWDRRMRFVVMT